LAPPTPPDRPRQPATRGRRGSPTNPTSTGQATAILAVGTFASRLTGFVRVLLIGYVLGVGPISDAFNIANGVPNIVYDLLLGGILSATLIPVFVDHLNDKDAQEGARAISAVLTAVAVALVAMSGLLWLFAPWVIRFYLILNSSSTGPAERALATKLLHDFAPQVFFLGAIVVSTALLNARRSFTAAALSPILNNFIAIAALLVTKFVASQILTAKTATVATTLDKLGADQRAIFILGFGTTAGYLVQFLVQLPAMRRAGLIFRPVWDIHHPAVRQVAGLSSWLVGVVLANQASLALITVLAASAKPSGGATVYQFSYQFFQLPYALIAVSVASAIMPRLAERWSSDDRAGFERQLVTGIRVTLALIVPIGMAYVMIAQPFIELAIRHGRVGATGAHLVASSLALFAIGLPGFSGFFLLMRAYQAMKDARSMFWIYVLENGLTVVSAVILYHVLGVPGLALAWVGPYTIASFVAAAHLRGRVGRLGGTATVRALIRIVVASGVSAGAVYGAGLLFGSSRSDPVLIIRLLVQVGAGAATYLLLARAMRIRELRPVIRIVRRMAGAR
jgi:putative peptidoglycan lipid II flippase